MNLLYWIMMVFPHVDGDSNSDNQDSEERMQSTAEHGDDGNTDTTSRDKEENEMLTIKRIFDALTKKFPLVLAADLRIKAEEISRSVGPAIWNIIVQKISEVCFKYVLYSNMAFLYRCFKCNYFPVSSHVFLV